MKHNANYLTRSLLIGVATALSSMAAAQVTPKSAFTTAPNNVFPFINQSQRLDMVDYFESGIDKKLPNLFDDDSRIISLTPTEIVVDYGAGNTVEFVPLNRKGSEIIMMINIRSTPTSDAEVRFFTPNWREIKTSDIMAGPSMSMWFPNLDKKQKAFVAEAVPFMTATATYDSTNCVLTFRPTLGDYIDADKLDEINKLITPEISFKWNGTKFVK